MEWMLWILAGIPVGIVFQNWNGARIERIERKKAQKRFEEHEYEELKNTVQNHETLMKGFHSTVVCAYPYVRHIPCGPSIAERLNTLEAWKKSLEPKPKKAKP